MREIRLVFEELPAPSPAPSLQEGQKKGEVVPPDAERKKATEGGLEGAEGGTEYK